MRSKNHENVGQACHPSGNLSPEVPKCEEKLYVLKPSRLFFYLSTPKPSHAQKERCGVILVVAFNILLYCQLKYRYNNFRSVQAIK